MQRLKLNPITPPERKVYFVVGGRGDGLVAGHGNIVNPLLEVG